MIVLTLELLRKKTKTKTQHGQNTHTYMRTHAHRVSYLDLNGHKLAYYVLLGLEQRFSLIVPFFCVCSCSVSTKQRPQSARNRFDVFKPSLSGSGGFI